MRVESSERIKRALRYNVRPTDSDNLVNGDIVYYKRKDDSQWRGPGTVIGKDGKQVLVRHGGIYVRVHSCRLQRGYSVCNKQESPNVEQAHTFDKVDTLGNCVTDNESDSENIERDDVACNSNLQDKENCQDTDGLPLVPFAPHEVSSEQSCRESQCLDSVSGKTLSGSYVGKRIEGICSDTGTWMSGKIRSRAGKATGKYKNCYNIQRDSDGGTGWMDLEKDFLEYKIVPENTEALLLFSNDLVMRAKEDEMKNWYDNGVFVEVEDVGQSSISTRWIVTEKYKNGKSVVKARLVARGFEEDTSSVRKDSPTCSKDVLRLSIAVMSCKGWTCHSLDVKSAFLQGHQIERDIYLRPPPEFDNGGLWKLKKTVYGLNDAARAWYLRVKKELDTLSVKMSSLDPALFYWICNHELQGIICLHVDDFFWAGTSIFAVHIINKLRDVFLIGHSENTAFKYVGLNIDSSTTGYTVDQFGYISTLKPIVVSRQRAMSKEQDLSVREKSEFRALVGQLNWIATQTRPDVAFAVCMLSSAISHANVGNVLHLNKIVENLKSESVKLCFPQLGRLEYCHLECYSDASFGNITGGVSQGGYIVFLACLNGLKCPISWQSRRIRRVVKSTLAAEALALLDGAEAAVYLVQIIREIGGDKSQLKVKCYVDNKSLVDALYSSKSVDDKRLRIDIAVLKDMMERKEIESVSWIATSFQLANCLTKGGAPARQLIAAISSQ